MESALFPAPVQIPYRPPPWGAPRATNRALSSCCAVDMALKVPLKLGRKVCADKSKCKAAAELAKLNGAANGMATGHLSVLKDHFSCTPPGTSLIWEGFNPWSSLIKVIKSPTWGLPLRTPSPVEWNVLPPQFLNWTVTYPSAPGTLSVCSN